MIEDYFPIYHRLPNKLWFYLLNNLSTEIDISILFMDLVFFEINFANNLENGILFDNNI
jgi:hypothetical protein